MIPLRRYQRFGFFVAMALTMLFVASRFRFSIAELSTGDSNPFSGSTHTSEQKGYDWIFKLVGANNPKVKPLLKYQNDIKAKEKFATDQDFIFSREYLDNLLVISEDDHQRLKKSHTKYVHQILADDHAHFGSELVVPSGDGIIFVGGVKFTWLVLIGLEQIRALGCTLPIEVFIGNEDDYEHDFCEVLLPKYNGRCTYLSHEAGDITKRLPVKLSGYQYKSLALLVSKFEKILFLDADNVPMKDPTPLFASAVFEEKGLVIWPDAWARTTSPKYYDIAGIKVSDIPVRGHAEGLKAVQSVNKDVNLHDLKGTLPNPSSESGMILVNKTKHVKTLLLSFYYNIFGPHLYYAIFSQGSAGEGDKETFIAAAHALGADYYQVQSKMKFIGYERDGSFNSKALGQADPIQDYKNFQNGAHLGPDNEVVKGKNFMEPAVQFMHLSYPKLIPFALLFDKEIIKDGNEHIRMYGGATQLAGYDFELGVFEIIAGLLCEEYTGPSVVKDRLIGLRLKEYAGQDERTLCPQLVEHAEWLEKNAETHLRTTVDIEIP